MRMISSGLKTFTVDKVIEYWALGRLPCDLVKLSKMTAREDRRNSPCLFLPEFTSMNVRHAHAKGITLYGAQLHVSLGKSAATHMRITRPEREVVRGPNSCAA